MIIGTIFRSEIWGALLVGDCVDGWGGRVRHLGDGSFGAIQGPRRQPGGAGHDRLLGSNDTGKYICSGYKSHAVSSSNTAVVTNGNCRMLQSWFPTATEGHMCWTMREFPALSMFVCLRDRKKKTIVRRLSGAQTHKQVLLHDNSYCVKCLHTQSSHFQMKLGHKQGRKHWVTIFICIHVNTWLITILHDIKNTETTAVVSNLHLKGINNPQLHKKYTYLKTINLNHFNIFFRSTNE